MVWKASEKEYAEYEAKKKAGTGQAGQKSQNIRMNGKPVPDRSIPANQQAARDLRAQKRKEQDTFASRHPTANRVVQGLKKAGHAAKEAGDRYVSAREESHRRLDIASREEKERYFDSWVSQSVWGSSLSKKKPSSRSGGSSDYYSYGLTNTVTGKPGGGGGLGMWGSSLPKKSTKKKKKPTPRRGRY